MSIVRRPDLTVTRRHALALGAAAGSLTLATRRAGAVRIDITEGNFRDFVFTNAVTLWGHQNPDFFKGTRVEKEAAAVLNARRQPVLADAAK